MIDDYFEPSEAPDVWTVKIRDADEVVLADIDRVMGLGLSQDEIIVVRDYFKKNGRDATDIELQSVAQAWSEHCSYKTSKPVLRRFLFPLSSRAYAMGDAGVMEFDARHVYSLKMESHNHPSAIEPYGGAGTGIGGIVRDILCMGTRPTALVDPIFFGHLDADAASLPSGTKHPKYLFSGVVAGIRDYGNRIGVPTVSGGVWFDRSYNASCLVNAGCLGFGTKRNIVKNSFMKEGDILVLAGGLTGRDGIHGVNFASRILTGQSHEDDRGAVQLGDPITKEPLIHAVMDLVEEGKIRSMKDLGGGGLSAVVGEMSLSGSLSAEIDIGAVHLREQGMKPWEIWVSESQERMLISVNSKDLEHVLSVFNFWDVYASKIGVVRKGNNVIVKHGGITILDLDTEFAVKAPDCSRSMKRRSDRGRSGKPVDMRMGLSEIVERILSDINISSRDWVVHMYDYEVGGKTAVKPLHGIPGFQSHGDASVIRPLIGSWKGLAVSVSAQPWIASVDPFQGSLYAVDELCRNLVAVGAKPDSLTNCLNFGNPEKPDIMWEFYESVRGLAEAAGALGLTVPSGNVSFYNDGEAGPIMPTVSLMGVGIIADIRKAVTSDFKREGSLLYLIGGKDNRLGCSEFARIFDTGDTLFPPVDLNRSSSLCGAISDMASEGAFLSCHDISQGGLFTSASEMAFGGNTGAVIDADVLGTGSLVSRLFSEAPTRWLAEVSYDNQEKIVDRLGDDATLVGTTGGRSIRVLMQGKAVYEESVDVLRRKWQSPLWDRMG
jgi:phosphoribosylformylglycinamidine synthase